MAHLLTLREEDRVHVWGTGQEVVLQVVGDLAPPGKLERFHRGILDVHVRVHSIANQQLDHGVLGRLEEVI